VCARARLSLCVHAHAREGGAGKGRGEGGKGGTVGTKTKQSAWTERAVDMKKDAACPLGEDAGARGSCGVFTPCQRGEESDNLDRSL
jgi:hypothetical protein